MNMQTDQVRAISDPSPDFNFTLTKIRDHKKGQPIQVSFAPIIVAPTHTSTGTPQTYQLHPAFNNDRRSYTPAFMLGIEQVKYQQTCQAFQRMHQARIEEVSSEKEEMLVPKPSKQSRVCCICREHFEDYLEHITTVQHVKKMHLSAYRKHIQTLCSQFSKDSKKREGRKRAGGVRKQKKIRKEKNSIEGPPRLVKIGTESSSTHMCMEDSCKIQPILQELS